MENRWENISDNLDRIKNLGYEVSLNWKERITINYSLSDGDRWVNIFVPMTILSYDYDNNSIDWLDVVEQVVDVFYSWYYENGIELNNLMKQVSDTNSKIDIDYILESISTLNDVTDMINRELQLNSILSEKKKWDF
jgi:hypothetical protein